MELGLFTDIQLQGNPGDDVESSSQTRSSLSPSIGNIMTEHEIGLSSATPPQSYWSGDDLGSTQALPMTGATQLRPIRRNGTPDVSTVSTCHQISLETQCHYLVEAPFNGKTVANRHKRSKAEAQETSNSSCPSSTACPEAADHTNLAPLHLQSVFGPGTKYNLSDKSLHEIADISENCMRPDLVEFLEETLTRWKKTGFWHQEQIPQPTANGAGRARLIDAYSCICRLESRMKDDQILNRVAVVMLHTAYEQACQEWRHAGAHQRKGRGRGDATTVIDDILSGLHEDWDVGDKKRYHRSRFHDKKRFGKRWLVLIKSLGIGILLSSSQRLASAVHTTLFTGDMLQALVYCIRQSQARQLLILELLNPIATLLVEGGRYEGIDSDRIISEKASSQPLEPAVETYDISLSYGDLCAMSSKLSQYLVSLGIYPEAKVVLMMEPSALYVVCTISVLKAGATFVPLDATQPTKRLAQLMKDIKPFIIITSIEVQDKAKGLYDDILVVDQSPSPWQRIPLTTGVTSHVKRSDAAYIIFTSGSTGLPKGVVIEHGAFSTSALARGNLTGLSLGSRVLQYAAHTFDVSIDEILTTLIHGGCVCIPPKADRLLLEPAIKRLQVNHALLTPTSAKTLDPDAVPSLKTLQLGGELIPDDLIRKWCSRVRLFNVYGPTEASVACIMSEKSQNDIVGNVIGFPVGSVCQIVDPGDHNQLVAHGVVGELVIGGQILARGYLDDCVRTASSFIESPPWNSDSTTTRFYKTGDLARIDDTGSVSIVGRKDNQIKIRGQRINVEEIETTLLATNLIRNSVVELPKKGPLANELVAIICTTSNTPHCKHLPPLGFSEQPLQTSTLRLDGRLRTRLHDALQDRLTNAMIPKRWIQMTSLPETTSGKVNRKEIRRWLETTDASVLQSVSLFNVESTGLRDSTGRKIQPQYEGILCRILGVNSALLKPHLSFIQNGGDSIAAIELCRLGRKIGISFRISSVLSDNSLEKLFHTSESRFPETITHESQPGTPFPLSPVQKFFFDVVGNEHSSFTQHVTLQLKKSISVAQLERVFDRLVSAHPMLRARFHFENGTWLQSIPQRVSGSYTILHCHSIGPPALKPMQPPVLSLTSDAVLYVRLWDLDDVSQQLQIIAHHLVVDLVSWRIILDDLSKVLRHEPLPTEGISFQTWCALQNEYATTLDPKLVLPIPIAPDGSAYWNPSAVQQENKHCMTETLTFSFDMSTFSSLLVGSLNKAQPVELMIGSFYTAFTKVFSDRETPTVFVESHGREPWQTGIDILQTVGWYTTAYPIHVPAQKAFDLNESTLHTMRARRSIPANGHPYWCHRFLQKCEPDKRKKSAPLEFVFNFAGQFQQLNHEDLPFRVMSTVGEETAEPEARRLSIFDIFISVEGDKLRFNISFPSWIRQKDRVHRLAAAWKNVLESAGVWRAAASDLQHHMLSSSSCNPSFYKVVRTWWLKHITNTHLVDTNRVQDAWKRVVTNHRGLRTILIPEDPERGFMAVVVEQSFPLVRIGGASDNSDTNGTTRPLGLQFNERSIHLPHRITFHTSNDESTLFSLEINHTVIDATSRSILMNELLDSLVGIDLGPDDSHYYEYIENRAALYSLSSPFQWPSCIFPPDLHCSDSNGSQLFTHVVELSQTCTANMTQICSQHGITMSSLLFLSWSLVPSNLTLSDNVSFSSVASGRSMDVPGIERFVGLYVDLLVLNIEACESDCLLESALRIQQMSAGSSLNQHKQIPACQNPKNGPFDGQVNTMVNIRNAGIDSLRLERHGFELSLDSFEDPWDYYEQWETLASSLPSRIRDGSLRHQVSLLPVLETEFLVTDAEWQRAYVVLGFLANTFIFCQYPPSERLPLSIAEPMMIVSCYLGLPRLPVSEQIHTLVSFTGSQEESAFFSVSVAIEKSTEAGNEKQLTAYLFEARITIDSMTSILPQLYDRCSPSFFYNTLRPFIEGTQDLKSAGLPHGVFFESKNGGSYQKFRGPSDAQSSLFCFIDIALGIDHNDNSFLTEMRQYMPAPHRDFLARVEVMANIRHSVAATADTSQLQDAYEGCVLALARFRQIHIRLVAKYIVIPSTGRKAAGPVVRINPFELHVNDPTFYPILCSSSTKKQDKWAWAAGMFGNNTSVFSTVPHDHHRIRRAALNPLFSRTAIKQLEPTIKSQIHELRQRLDSFCESGMVLDLGLAFTVFAADVISAYCFGELFGLLQDPDFAPEWVETVAAPSELGHLIKQFPWALGLFKWVPKSLIGVISPAIACLYTIQECIVVALYRFFLHLLATFPGPFWWKLSIWLTVWQCARGKRHLDLLAAHRRHGSVVRIGPNMLSYNTGSAARSISASRHANVRKSDYHSTVDASVSTPSLFSIVDREKHAFRRRVVSQAFTEKAMNDASEFYLEYSKVLFQVIHDKVGTGWAKVDIEDYASWWTADTMGDLTLGRSFNYLTEPTFRHAIPMMRNGLRYIYWSDASLLLAAGSDAMSNAIAGIMFYLARHDFARNRAAAEVCHQFASADDILQGPGLAACTYVEACILESMRMAPPVATSPLERVTVGNGIEVDGHWFPAGITLGVCFYALNFNETIHKDPCLFWPERWLSSENGATNGFTAEDVQQSKSNFFPFSAGHRHCPAQNLASRNFKVFIANMIWHFDFRPATNLRADESSGEEGQTGLFCIEDALISIVHGPVLEFKARLGDNASSS
ncbi:acetyl synthetase [Fusarium sp. NRRL 25303]|nr:acetyl synthetase [Fusarium sp. NRRL 25303]